MPEHEPLDYRLRCHSKRTDLPPDVLRDICEAYDLIHEGRQVNTGMEYEDVLMRNQELMAMIDRLTLERDEARLKIGRILNEIDCRVEHGADSNGHLEGIAGLFKEDKN